MSVGGSLFMPEYAVKVADVTKVAKKMYTLGNLERPSFISTEINETCTAVQEGQSFNSSICSVFM